MADKLFTSSMFLGESQHQLASGSQPPNVDSSEIKLKRQLSDYVIVERQTSLGNSSDLGKGAFGIVKLVKDTHTGKLFAMKIVRMGSDASDSETFAQKRGFGFDGCQ